ncbi:MAG: glycoside hydrolase family 3 C-terminal domain-containing protein [Rikenellaceae bacterium]
MKNNLLSKRASLLLLSSFLIASSYAQEQKEIYKDLNYSFEERAEDLVSRMTLEQKASQMVNAAKALPDLGVPKYNWWNECLHGLARAGKATVFPQSIGLGATFDPDLIYRMADAISDEARAFYNAASKRGNRGIYTGLTFYSPNINIFRDPRWGRGQETYGEDPFLTSQLGVSFVKGLQGDDERYLKTAACAKHYAVHSGPEKLRHEFDAICSNRDLYETYLPAFKALVMDAKVESVMGAYNRTNGEVCCGSKTLLIDILRGDWGFEGYVTSDCGAIVDFYRDHKVVANATEATALAVKNGLNLNCGSVYDKELVKAVELGMITEEEIDDLLVPLMTTRFKLGLFDPEENNPYNSVDPNIVDSKKHKDLAYETALKSMVLLENKNNTLPIKQDIRQLFVTGPNANNADALIGNYFGVSDKQTTFLSGISNRAPKGVSIQYKQGVLLDKPNSNPIDWATGNVKDADVTIACMGLTWLLEGEEGEAIASNQMGDMYDNSLPKAQIDYLKKLKATAPHKPLVVVISGGCPVQLNEIKEIADALIYAWYPGEAGGNALADILFGNQNPSGRLPMTFVESLEQLPPFEDYNMEGRTYRYMTQKPLYHFGYGLSYTDFDFSDAKVIGEISKDRESVRVEVKVKNSGNMDGEEVVQLYVKDNEASVATAIHSLAALDRVFLKAGETKTVTLEIPIDKFSIYTDNDTREVEKGSFTITVGGGQPVESTHDYETISIENKKNIKLNIL